MQFNAQILENKYAVPNHPLTCSNPAPWKIVEVKIDQAFSSDYNIYIRGEGSMWFNLANCFVGDENEAHIVVEGQERRRLLASLSFQLDTEGNYS
jgi:hypothetical protein